MKGYKKVESFEFSPAQIDIINEYCWDNLRKLKQVCKKSITVVCKDSNIDKDSLYSIAMDVLMDNIRTYDNDKGSFDAYLSSNIQRKIYTYIRDTKYTHKRNNMQKNEEGKYERVSNIPIDEITEDGIDLSERLDSGFRIENEISDEFGLSSNTRWSNYLKRLSRKQREVVSLIINGYKASDIKEILHISENEYRDCMSAIKSLNNLSILMGD